jgi:hypothetical protein
MWLRVWGLILSYRTVLYVYTEVLFTAFENHLEDIPATIVVGFRVIPPWQTSGATKSAYAH